MRGIWESLQFKLNNTIISSCIKIGISDMKLNLGKNILDKKLLSMHEGLNNILKEHEQRKKAVEKLIIKFKATGKKKFSRLRKKKIFLTLPL